MHNRHLWKAKQIATATLYNVEVGELKIGIIDTPGFGDSRGLKQDERYAKRIMEVLKKEEYINCVCLIINGCRARTSASLQYVLTEITAILPREILQNLIVIFSNTSDPLDLNLDPSELTAYFGRPVPQDLVFFIENPYCRFEKAKAKVAQLGIERVANNLERSYNDTVRVLNEIFLKLKISNRCTLTISLHFTKRGMQSRGTYFKSPYNIIKLR